MIMTSNKSIRLIGISGSLKAASSNTGILKALAKIAPENVSVKIWEGLDTLPHFNPDTTRDITVVNLLRKELMDADGIIFSTPEYAFGVPGVLKNALDWLVLSGELNKKPVIAISASPLHTGGEKALTSLLLTLTALGTAMDKDASLSIANIKNKMSETGEVKDPGTLLELERILNCLIQKIKSPVNEEANNL
jgi:chromate reductase, NAD(P)H dehydrogenase (quinone)